MPKGGFGNLIALPLQKFSREQGNSVFFDDNLHPYEDQWSYFARIEKITSDELAAKVKETTAKGGMRVLYWLKEGWELSSSKKKG